MQAAAIAQMLVLIVAANGAPVAAHRLLGPRLSWPLDGGVNLWDGRPLFGPAKTWRGILVGLVAAIVAAPLVGMAWQIGALAGAAAILGDLLSSFLKRRLGFAPSSRALGLDQIPESLFPFLACAKALSLGIADILLGTAIFWAGGVLASRLLHRLRLRERPY